MSEDFDFSAFNTSEEPIPEQTQVEPESAIPAIDVNEFNALKQQLAEQTAFNSRWKQDMARMLTGEQAQQAQLTPEELLNLQIHNPLQYKQMLEDSSKKTAESIVDERLQQFMAQQQLNLVKQEFSQKYQQYAPFWNEVSNNAAYLQQQAISVGRQLSDSQALDIAVKDFETRLSGINQAQRAATVRNQALSLNPGRTSPTTGDLATELKKLSNEEFFAMIEERKRQSVNY